MVNRVLMWAAANPRLERQVTENPITRRAAHRLVAGERLEETIGTGADPDPRGIGSILELLGEGPGSVRRGAVLVTGAYAESVEPAPRGRTEMRTQPRCSPTDRSARAPIRRSTRTTTS
jgi:proline dehydrogenase